MNRGTTILALVIALAVLTESSEAQDGLKLAQTPAVGFGATVGLGVMYAPRYLGASESRMHALPLVQVRWGENWSAGVDGIGYKAGLRPGWQVGLRLGWDRGRDESDAAALRGMGNIPARAELAATSSLRLLPFLVVGTGLRYGSGADRNGLVADISLRSVVPIADRVRVMFGVSGQWANHASMQSLFGVTEGQSAASGYSVYVPGSGWFDVGSQLTVTTDLGQGWQMMARLDQRRLLGNAGRSPLVQDKLSTSGALMMMWRY
jgi:MipA family protein